MRFFPEGAQMFGEKVLNFPEGAQFDFKMWGFSLKGRNSIATQCLIVGVWGI
jgi:hypothetical protein